MATADNRAATPVSSLSLRFPVEEENVRSHVAATMGGVSRFTLRDTMFAATRYTQNAGYILIRLRKPPPLLLHHQECERSSRRFGTDISLSPVLLGRLS